MIPLSEDFVNEWNQPNKPVFDHALYQKNEMLKLVNELRESKGLNSLTYNPDVQYGADIRAIEAGHEFDHVRHNGESWKTVLMKKIKTRNGLKILRLLLILQTPMKLYQRN